MNTRHTPGPWKMHSNIGRKSEPGVIADAAPCIIAIMGNHKEWPVEAEANARLIAAAPELLEALEDMLSLAKSYDVGQNSAIVDRASALIARTTGGKP